MEQGNYSLVDLARFFFALVVIAIHTAPLNNCDIEWVQTIFVGISELANPFFFMAIGFFLQLKMDKNEKNEKKDLQKYLYKSIKLYCIWTIAYLPISIYGYVVSGNSVARSIFSYVKYFFFVGKIFGSHQLWFLLSVIYSILIILLLKKWNVSKKVVVMIAVVLFIFDSFITYGSMNLDLIPGIFRTLLNSYLFVFNNGGIWRGMLYIVIGMEMVKSDQKLSIKCKIPLFLLMFILQDKITFLPLSHIWYVAEIILLFTILLHIKIKERKCYIYFRKISMLMYFSHMLVFMAYKILIVGDIEAMGMESFVVTVIGTICLSSIILMVQNKIKGKRVDQDVAKS